MNLSARIQKITWYKRVVDKAKTNVAAKLVGAQDAVRKMQYGLFCTATMAGFAIVVPYKDVSHALCSAEKIV